MSRLDLSFFSCITPAEEESLAPLGPFDSLAPPEQEEPEEPFALSSLPNGPMDGLIGELRAYQAELEAQNKVLRYSQAAAESASERFETLFSSVPLALMWWASTTWWCRPTRWRTARSSRPSATGH